LEPEKKQKQDERPSFRDIFNQMQKNVSSVRDTFKEEKCGHLILPSINQLDF